MMVPTVGRIVYLNMGGGVFHACIITGVGTTTVDFTEFPPGGPPVSHLGIARGKTAGFWDWMPYQKEKAASGDHNSESAEPRP